MHSGLLADTFQVSLPSLTAILLCRMQRISRRIYPSASDDEVGSSPDRSCWCLILLAKIIILASKIDARSEHQKVLRIGTLSCGNVSERLVSNPAHHRIEVGSGQFNALRGVITSCETSLRAHFGKKDESSLARVREFWCLDDSRQCIHNTVPAKNTEIDNVSEFRYLQRSTVVLLLNRAADVYQLAIFEDEEVVLLSKSIESVHCALVEIFE